MNYSSYISKYNSANFKKSDFTPTIWKAFEAGHHGIVEIHEGGMYDDADFEGLKTDYFNHFQKMLEQVVNSTPEKKATAKKGPGPKKATTTRKATATKKTPAKRKTAAKKTATRRNLPAVVKNAKPTTRVRTNPLESELGLSLIRKFLNMIGKKRTRNSVQLLLNRINKAAVGKEIRLKSQFSKPLKFIAESAVAALNTNYATIKFAQTKEGTELLEPYMNDKEATSIRLLRQFYNTQNKKFTTRHETLVEKLKQIDKDDPFSVEAKAAVKTLLTARQNGTVIKATRATLRGLDGICKKKGNSLNGLDGMGLHPAIAGAFGGAASGVIGGTVYRALSGVEIINSKYEYIPLPSKYKGIGLDYIPFNASILMFAFSGYGKSTLALEFAQEFSVFGKTAYISYEEFTSDGKPTGGLRNRLKRIQSGIGLSKNVDYFPSMEGVNIDNYQFIFIDSIDDANMTIKDWENLRAKYPTKFFVLIAQVTKSGVFRGSNRWGHKVDVIYEFPEVGVAVGRKRYGTGTYNFYNETYT